MDMRRVERSTGRFLFAGGEGSAEELLQFLAKNDIIGDRKKTRTSKEASYAKHLRDCTCLSS